MGAITVTLNHYIKFYDTVWQSQNNRPYESSIVTLTVTAVLCEFSNSPMLRSVIIFQCYNDFPFKTTFFKIAESIRGFFQRKTFIYNWLYFSSFEKLY